MVPVTNRSISDFLIPNEVLYKLTLWSLDEKQSFGLVMIAVRNYLIPFRTQSSNTPAATIVSGQLFAKIARRQAKVLLEH